MVLHDFEETRAFVNAFPLAQYERFEVPGVGQYWVDDAQDLIKSRVAAGVQWEPHVLAILEEHIEPGMVVLEVGAHIGTHTIPLARLVGPYGRVYAFEPQRKLFGELHHNLALNAITNAYPLRFAIGSGEARVVEMNPSRDGNEGGTSVGTGGDLVELRELDSFGFGRVTAIKIDAEGLEKDVLAGAEETILKNRPVIVLEIAGTHPDEKATPGMLERIQRTLRLLEALDYSVERVQSHDHIALPRQRSAL